MLVLTHAYRSFCGTEANNANPDQTPQNAASDQGFHCLLTKRSLGRVAQSVTCLATDASLTADPGVAGSIPAQFHTSVEIVKYFLRSFSSFPLNHSRRIVVSYKRKCVQEVLVNCLFKLAQEKVWLG